MLMGCDVMLSTVASFGIGFRRSRARNGSRVCLDPPRRAPRRGRHRTLGRQSRRQHDDARAPKPSTAFLRRRSSVGAGPWPTVAASRRRHPHAVARCR
jgi:hypothetical protein